MKLCGFTDADWVGSPTDRNINIRYHHIRDCVQQRIMLLSYIPTEDQDADILTKSLTRSKFKYHRDRIGVSDNPYLVERECSKCNKMMELSEKKSPSLSGPAGFGAKSIFRLCLF